MAKIFMIDGSSHQVEETKEDIDKLITESKDKNIVRLGLICTITGFEKDFPVTEYKTEPCTFVISSMGMYF